MCKYTSIQIYKCIHIQICMHMCAFKGLYLFYRRTPVSVVFNSFSCHESTCWAVTLWLSPRPSLG